MINLDVLCEPRVAIGQGKVREILFFFKVGEKLRELCKMVKEILNTKKVMEKSWNFPIFIQNCLAVSDILSILSDPRTLSFFFSVASFARNDYKFMFLENVWPKALKHFIYELNK